MLNKSRTAFNQITAVLVLMALVTCGTAFYIANLTHDHDVEVRIREINTTNRSTTRIVEENIRLMLSQADNILMIMKTDMEK